MTDKEFLERMTREFSRQSCLNAYLRKSLQGNDVHFVFLGR